MRLHKLSLGKAIEITNMYLNILNHKDKSNRSFPHRYSSLGDADIDDVRNSFYILLANKVLNRDSNDENIIKDLEEEVDQIEALISHFLLSFMPDSTCDILEKFGKTSDEYIAAKSEMYAGSEFFSEQNEIIDSKEFLKFCLQLDNKLNNYWDLIYKKLGIIRDLELEKRVLKETKPLNIRDIISHSNKILFWHTLIIVALGILYYLRQQYSSNLSWGSNSGISMLLIVFGAVTFLSMLNILIITAIDCKNKGLYHQIWAGLIIISVVFLLYKISTFIYHGIRLMLLNEDYIDILVLFLSAYFVGVTIWYRSEKKTKSVDRNTP